MTMLDSSVGGLILSAVPMTADITASTGNARLLNIEGVSKVGLHITSNGGDHVGTIYFRQTATRDSTVTPVSMTNPTVTVSSGSALDAWVDLIDLCGKYLEVFFDRTSGTTGTLTVRAFRKRDGR